MHILDVETEFHANADGLYLHGQQEIDRDHIDSLRACYDASTTAPMGDYHRVASIPVAVVEKWMREGFDLYKKGITAREIVSRLRAEHLDYFITTKRRV